MMAVWIAFVYGIVIGFFIAILAIGLLEMAARTSRDMEEFEAGQEDNHRRDY